MADVKGVFSPAERCSGGDVDMRLTGSRVHVMMTEPSYPTCSLKGTGCLSEPYGTQRKARCAATNLLV
jgi:hypothetical protein